jgi:hypothetical protein
MAAVAHRPLALPRDGASARARRALSSRARAAHVVWWRWLPWTAPRLALGRNVRPQTRLELALCALFRCQVEWPASRLVERLAQAPLGSDDNLALVGSSGGRSLAHLGRGAAWDAVQEWLERGLVAEVRGASPAPAQGRATALPGEVRLAEPRTPCTPNRG